MMKTILYLSGLFFIQVIIISRTRHLEFLPQRSIENYKDGLQVPQIINYNILLASTLNRKL